MNRTTKAFDIVVLRVSEFGDPELYFADSEEAAKALFLDLVEKRLEFHDQEVKDEFKDIVENRLEDLDRFLLDYLRMHAGYGRDKVYRLKTAMDAMAEATGDDRDP